MITEAEIDEKLKRLRGKVPNFLIDDIKSRLLEKKEILTPEQVDKIIDRVLNTYSGQLEKLSKLDRRVEEIGKYLEEIRNQLLTLGAVGSSIPSQLDQPTGSNREKTVPGQFGGAQPQETEGAFETEDKMSPTEGSPITENIGRYIPESGTIPEDVGGKSTRPPEGGVGVETMVGRQEPSGKFEPSVRIPPEVEGVVLSTPQPQRGTRLERIPNDMVSTVMALKWLEFLIDRVGMQNLEDVLDFYYQIGWISEDVLYTMLRYAEGIRPHHREPDWRPDEKLTIQDHMVSLLFIERLKGNRITRELVDVIDREMRSIMRFLNETYGV
ncbi:FlaD/FlaE family flagellar protein [Thermococcus sp.]